MERPGPTLEQLQSKAQQIESAINQVGKTSKDLGGVEGPARFRWDITSGIERVLRIDHIHGIREQIETRTKPALASHLKRVEEDIKTHRVSVVQAAILRIEEAASKGYLTPQELEAAKQEAGQILGTIQFTQSREATAQTLEPQAPETLSKTPRIDVDEESTMPDGTKRYYTAGVEVFPDGQPATSTTQLEEPVTSPAESSRLGRPALSHKYRLQIAAVQLPNEKQVQILGPLQARVIQELARVYSEGQTKLTPNQIAARLGENSKAVIDTLYDLKNEEVPANKSLRDQGWKINSEKQTTGKHASLVWLERIPAEVETQPEEQPASPVEPPVLQKYTIEQIVDKLPWKEKSKLPKITINLETHEVEIDGKRVKVQGKIIWAVMLYFAQNPKKEIHSQEIEKIAEGAGSKSAYAGGKAVNNLVRATGLTRTMLTRVGRMASSKYILNTDVEIIGELPQPLNVLPAEKTSEQKKQEAKFPYIPVYEQKIAALNAFIDNQNITIEEIIDILGPSYRTGRRLTRQQAFWSLRVHGGTNLLYVRVKGGIANQAEQDLWAKIRQFTGMEDDRDAFDLLNGEIDSWYKSRRTVTASDVAQVEIMERLKVEEPTIEEAAILGELLLIRNNTTLQLGRILVTLEVEQDVEAAIKTLVGQLPIQQEGNLDQVMENYIKRRPQVLTKFIDLVRSEKFEEILDGMQNEDIKSILMWLSYQDREEIGQVFLKLLAEKPDFIMQYEGQQLMRVWQEWKDMPVITSYVEPPARARTLAIERRDPNVLSRIKEILGQINQRGITQPIDNPQMTKFFPVLKVSYVKNMTEKRAIRPNRGRDHHPVFSPEEIAVMLYLYQYEEGIGGITPRMIRELNQIIETEIEIRKKAANNHSGK